MHKFTVVEIDTHMALFKSRFEKNQVAGLHLSCINSVTAFSLQCRGTWHVFVKFLPVGEVNKTGTVDAIFREPAVFVRNPAPAVVLLVQQVDDLRVIRGGGNGYGNAALAGTANRYQRKKKYENKVLQNCLSPIPDNVDGQLITDNGIQA